MPRINGKLTIHCLRVGQGDCTIVQCPDGHITMIDLGSTKAEPLRENDDDLQEGDDDDDGNYVYIPGKHFLPDAMFADLFNQDKHLNNLILTHHDRDHYNWLGRLFDADVLIDNVYFSGEFTSYYHGSKAGGGGRASWLISRMCVPDYNGETQWDKIRGVTCNAFRTQFYDFEGLNVIGIPNGNGIGQYTEGKGIKVYQGAHTAIYILCSNVTETMQVDDDDDDEELPPTKRRKKNPHAKYIKRQGPRAINMASIMTLIEHRDMRFVICGDAVDATEEFIIDRYPQLEHVEFVRVAHHGSWSEGSSHEAFIQQMNPRTIFISAPFYSARHKHPRAEIVDRFVLNAPRVKRDELVRVGCWRWVEHQEEKKGTNKKKRGRTYWSDDYSVEYRLADVRTTGTLSTTQLEFD